MTTVQLDALIAGLQEYAAQGVVDPWILSDGSIVQPLAALIELKAARARIAELEAKADEMA